ncbi:ATP-binding cassette domain-containing protein [Pannonibacter sp. Pt2-lr]
MLFGENGAGKSTLISVLAGVNQPSAGEIRIDGEPVHFVGVRDAQAAGVGAVFQEFSLVPTMTVAENIYLGDEPRRGPFIDRRAMRREAHALFARLGFEVDVSRRVLSLSAPNSRWWKSPRRCTARRAFSFWTSPQPH